MAILCRAAKNSLRGILPIIYEITSVVVPIEALELYLNNKQLFRCCPLHDYSIFSLFVGYSSYKRPFTNMVKARILINFHTFIMYCTVCICTIAFCMLVSEAFPVSLSLDIDITRLSGCVFLYPFLYSTSFSSRVSLSFSFLL